VIADPNPITVWTHIDAKGKAREIKRTTDKFNGNYTIHNARVEDSGTYLCNASNALGKVFYATKIKIEPGLFIPPVFIALYPPLSSDCLYESHIDFFSIQTQSDKT
jgi:hypothetical protein